MAKNKDKEQDNKVILKPKGGMLATFVHLDEPDDFGKGDKYTVTVIIPKSDKKLVKQVKEAIKAAMDRGLDETFKGKNPKKAHNPLKDGDDEDTETYEYYKDAYFIKFSTKVKPTVINKSREKLSGEDEVYSGMKVWVSGVAYPFFTEGSWGVSMILGNVVKVDDGERMGGGGGFDLEDEFGDDLEEDEFADDEDEDDDYPEDDEGDGDGLDKSEAEDLIGDIKDIDKKAARKFSKKLDKIDDEDDLDELVEELEEWLEDNE